VAIDANLEQILNRMKNLQKWKIVVPIPEDFQFDGVVPYSMTITNGTAVVEVYAMTIDEAKTKAKAYFNGPP
jgi:hypothetical protein